MQLLLHKQNATSIFLREQVKMIVSKTLVNKHSPSASSVLRVEAA